MAQSLYQKYRPQSWRDVCDQQHIKVTLQHQLERNTLAHAYLFVGPRGVGKTTLARLLAKSVNCEQRQPNSAEPCNVCPSCVRIVEQRSFDIVEIDAASHTGVDNVRENILAAAEVTASHNSYRVFIIDEVHMLSTAAFNAMLKMLEEPPRHVIFILATTELHKVPATIVSRCQRFDLKRVPTDAMRERLKMLCVSEQVTVDDDVISAIAEQADGSLRDAESMLGQVLAIGEKHITFDEASLIIPRSNRIDAAKLFGLIIDTNTAQALEFVNQMVEEGVNVKVFMTDCVAWLRAVLLTKLNNSTNSLFATSDTVGLLQKQADVMSINALGKLIDIYLNRQATIARTVIPQLPLELCVIESVSIFLDEMPKSE